MRRMAVATWVRLARVFTKMDRALVSDLRSRDLSLAQFDVLAQVGEHEGLTQQELADRLLVTKGNICQLLDRMTQSGLVARRQEGRTNRVQLTEAGRQLRERVVPEHEAAMERLLAALTPYEQHQLNALLRKLDRSLE